MREYAVRVGVATCRPPREHAVVYVRIMAQSATKAQVEAVWMVMTTRPEIVMAVSTEIVSVV